ncbi:MAG: hypothetical protein ACKO96_03840 [Flammeovirgaceae bacterium]
MTINAQIARQREGNEGSIFTENEVIEMYQNNPFEYLKRQKQAENSAVEEVIDE